jgi:hypothetical protein
MPARIRSKPIQKGKQTTTHGEQERPRRSISSQRSPQRRQSLQQSTQWVSESIIADPLVLDFNQGIWSTYRVVITEAMTALENSSPSDIERKREAFASSLSSLDSLQALFKDTRKIMGDDVPLGYEVSSCLSSLEKFWTKCLSCPTASSIGILRVIADQVLIALKAWSSQVRIKPDSERLDELLPSVTCSERELHFANRTEPMKKLLKIHLGYLTRRKAGLLGGNKIFPLLDSLYGMGKTTFSKKYLAMVERWIREIRDAIHSVNDDFVADSILSALGYDDVFLCPGIEDVVQLVCEFRQARTLYVKFKSGGAISMTQLDQRERDVIKLVCGALREEWKIIVDSSDFSDFSELLRFIAKPVFIVLDEIGAAFASDFATQDEQRNAFNSFVDTLGTHLMDHPGVYFILSGRADFLWQVKSETGGSMTRMTTATGSRFLPVFYERI